MLKNVLLSVCMRLLSIDDLNSFIFIDDTVRFSRTHLLFFFFLCSVNKSWFGVETLRIRWKRVASAERKLPFVERTNE